MKTQNTISFNKLTLCLTFALLFSAVSIMANDHDREESTLILPHYEDFSNVITPALPQGWTTHIESTSSSVIETTQLQNPYSPPSHLRFRPIGDANAQLILITPHIEEAVNTLRVRFHARGSSATATAIQLGTWDTISENFTLYHTLPLTADYEPYHIEMDQYAGDNQKLAFKAIPGGSHNTVFLDNIIIDQIPDAPELRVTPQSHNFGQLQTGVHSHPKEFEVSNQGTDTLTIFPQLITLTGANNASFLLNNITDTLHLGPFDSAGINITFAPQNTGNKEATLVVGHLEVPLSGQGIDASITQFPHLEDFNGVPIPDLPFGWSSFVYHPTSANARVENSTTGTPVSPPNHVRLYSNQEPDAIVMLISPPVANLANKQLSLWVRAHLVTGLPDLIVGSMSNPTDIATFSPFDTIAGLTNTYQQFNIFFNDAVGNDEYLVFLFGDNAMQWTFVYLDNIELDEISEEPQAQVNPSEFDFGLSQTGDESSPKTFVISNQGGGLLTLEPGDITIAGPNATDFLLADLEQEVNLGPGQTATIQVTFAPATSGSKNATLQVEDFEVILTGTGHDFTIGDFPWSETFSGVDAGQIPEGWLRDRPNWAVMNTSNAGGESPELRFNWVPEFNGISYFKSPRINTEGISRMMLSFRHRVNNFQAPGSYTLKVVALANDQEYLIHEWVDPDNISSRELTFMLSADEHGIGDPHLRLAWVFEGNSYDISNWYVDDIFLDQAFTTTFTVMEDSDEELPVQGASIIIDGIDPLITDELGTASVELPQGSYTADITHEDYTSQTISFTVDSNSDIDVFLQDKIRTPFALEITTDGMQSGEALFSWMADYDVFRYDDGIATGQLGFQDGDINSVMGAAHHEAAVLHELSWFLTDNAGPYPTVKLWVLGLDENGAPDRNNIIYSAEEVTNAHMEWNTYAFESPLEAHQGFFIGVSANGFLALATDDGNNEPWEFVPGTQFANLNIMNPEFEFQPIEAWDFENNFLIRGYGQSLGELKQETRLITAGNAQEPIHKKTPESIVVGDPLNKSQKVFTGFNVFLNGDLMAENHSETEFLFTGLAEGNHTAGVKSMYSTGASPVAEIEFYYSLPEEPTFTVTFTVLDEDENPVTDAVITLDTITNAAGNYIFEEVENGTWPYSVYSPGYIEYSSQLTVDNQNLTIEVILTEVDLGAHSMDISNINIYPNPARTEFHIRSADRIEQITVSEITGRIIYKGKPNHFEHSINTDNWHPGMYIVQIYVADKTVSRLIQILKN